MNPPLRHHLAFSWPFLGVSTKGGTGNTCTVASHVRTAPCRLCRRKVRRAGTRRGSACVQPPHHVFRQPMHWRDPSRGSGSSTWQALQRGTPGVHPVGALWGVHRAEPQKVACVPGAVWGWAGMHLLCTWRLQQAHRARAVASASQTQHVARTVRRPNPSILCRAHVPQAGCLAAMEAWLKQPTPCPQYRHAGGWAPSGGGCTFQHRHSPPLPLLDHSIAGCFITAASRAVIWVGGIVV